MPGPTAAQTDGRARRSGVTDVHRKEAAALKNLFERYQASQLRSGVKVTQIGFAHDHGIGTTQGIIWQYLNAKIPLNLQAAVKFAEGLRVQVKDFSPRLAAEQAKLGVHGGAPAALPGPKTALQSVLELNPMEQQLLGLYRDLKPEQRDELLAIANDLFSKAYPQPSAANPYGDAPKKRQRERETR